MKKLTIHAGPHKTGSSYMQHMFVENMAALEKEGLVYPEDLLLFKGHHEVANYFFNKNKWKDSPKLVTKINAIENDVLLSSENFSKLDFESLKALGAAFSGFEISIVYYLRNPSFRLFSWWQELVRHGHIQGFFEYAFPHVASPFKSDVLNPTKFIQNSEQLFGQGSTKIISYEHAKQNTKMLEMFWKACGLPVLIADAPRLVNTMRDIAEIEILRYLNLLAKTDGLLHGPNLREAFLQYCISTETNEINDLRKRIHGYDVEFEIGELGLDHSIIAFVHDKFRDNFVNSVSAASSRVIKIPQDLWLSDTEIINELKGMYSEFSRFIKKA
jgi:hypothetical protein